MRYRFCKLAAALALLLAPALLQAGVSEEEAQRLGGDLTPFGAEAAGNADGSIPPWTGQWLGVPPGLEYQGPGSKPPNPYAGEQPLFSITPENYSQYREHLSDGQIAMFERYPTFRMDIYPSHRDFAFQPRMVEKAAWNARHTELSSDAEAIRHYTGGIAFPIPAGPEEILWNTRTNYCHATMGGVSEGWGVFSNGERAHEANDYVQSIPFNNPDNPIPTTEEVVGEYISFAYGARLAPPRQKGEVTVAQEPIDYKNSSRNAWQYRPDTRRVRKAPAIGYDNPDGPGGLQTIDDHEGFNGALDRFTYTLVGKREIYIPYHDYAFNDPSTGDLDSRLTINHANPDYLRYELHRVWVVEGNLAPGKRHAYSKRRWYIDEDSWNFVLSENFDSRGNLWRVGFFTSEYQYDVQCYVKHTVMFHDLPSGHYMARWVTLERDEVDYTMPYRDKSYFTPEYLRKSVRR
ncbi:DUF1329 domain-containing protein [Haliea sp. E17]|uniref:DUF1329 domain-containing protein n=1 Tax=Haliea sp. E17 TaxID=3401576 RepID=UPI003AAFAB96